MTDAILVIPPHDRSYKDMGFVADRLGVGYLAATLRRSGFKASVLHCPALWLEPETAAEEIARQKPALVGISALFSETDMVGMVQLAQAVRELLPHTHITVGGHPPSLTSGEILTQFPEIDSVVRAEGEITLLELMKQVASGCEWRQVAGLSHFSGGYAVRNSARPLIRNLDQLPFPSRDVFELIPPDRASVGMISSSRGCFGRCIFCSIRSFYGQAPGQVWRPRSAENVMAEIELLRKRWSIKTVQFIDDNFMGTGLRGKQRALAIAEALIRRKIHLQLTIESRTDCVDEEVFAALRRAGLSRVFLGIESGVQRALDFLHKGTSVETNRRAIDILHRLGIQCLAGFIAFDPFTTPAELHENIRFLNETGLTRELDAYPRFLNRLQVYPGSPVEKLLIGQGLLEPMYDPRLRGYVNSYRFRFRDSRTEALFHAASAAGYSPEGRFLLASDLLHLRDRWSLWLKLISSQTGLSLDILDRIPTLQGPFMRQLLEPWLRARWECAMAMLLAMAIELEQNGKVPDRNDDLPKELRRRMDTALADVDMRYLGTNLNAKLHDLQNLLSQPRVSFHYQNTEYITLMERAL